MSDYQSGVEHDVLITTSMLFPQHYAVGDLLNLQPYVDQWDQAEVEDFSWNPVWDICCDDGDVYGIPLGLHIRGLVYRKDLFEQAGLDPESPPTTIEELLEYAEILTNPDENVYGLGIWSAASILSYGLMAEKFGILRLRKLFSLMRRG